MFMFEAMSKNPQTVTPNMSVRDAAVFMERSSVGALPVVDNGSACGIITDRDIALRSVAAGSDPAKIKVSEIMTPNPIQIAETASVDEAVTLLMEHRIGRVLVHDETGQLVGIFSTSDAAVFSESNWEVTALTTQIARRDRDKSHCTHTDFPNASKLERTLLCL